MLRLLGILSLGNLLFGGHHHRRALRRGLLLGARRRPGDGKKGKKDRP